MKHSILKLILTVLVFVTFSNGNDYYVANEGDNWRYNGSILFTGNGKVDNTLFTLDREQIASRIMNGKKVDVVKTYTDQKFSSLDFSYMDGRGMYSYGEQDVGSVSPEIYNRMYYKYPPTVGTSWIKEDTTYFIGSGHDFSLNLQCSIISNNEDVIVTAGEYKNCLKIKCQGKKTSKKITVEIEDYLWLAPRVGEVKNIYVEKTTILLYGFHKAVAKYTLELKSYTPSNTSILNKVKNYFTTTKKESKVFSERKEINNNYPPYFKNGTKCVDHDDARNGEWLNEMYRKGGVLDSNGCLLKKKNIGQRASIVTKSEKYYQKQVSEYKPKPLKVESLDLSGLDVQEQQVVNVQKTKQNISPEPLVSQNPKKIDLSNNSMDISVTYKAIEEHIKFKVKATNTGSNAKGGVSISFPTLQNRSVVKDMSNNGFSSVDVYGTGSRIWHSIKKRLVNADYLLVEGWNKVWKSGETKTMSFSIDKSILPSQAFNARAIIIKGKKEFLSPKFGPKDQQGYPVKSLVIYLSKKSKVLNNTIIQKIEDSCNSGQAEGCHALAISYESGSDVKKDLVKAKELYRKYEKYAIKECNQGMLNHCNLLGITYETGVSPGIPKNIGKAKEIYRKSCDGGNEQGCKDYKRINYTKESSEILSSIQRNSIKITNYSHPEDEPKGLYIVDLQVDNQSKTYRLYCPKKVVRDITDNTYGKSRSIEDEDSITFFGNSVLRKAYQKICSTDSSNHQSYHTQQTVTPVVVNHTDIGTVRGISRNGDGFIAVRSGPGGKYKMIDKFYRNSEKVTIVDTKGKWKGVVYGDSNCLQNLSKQREKPYKGACKTGWVYGKYINVINKRFRNLTKKEKLSLLYQLLDTTNEDILKHSKVGIQEFLRQRDPDTYFVKGDTRYEHTCVQINSTYFKCKFGDYFNNGEDEGATVIEYDVVKKDNKVQIKKIYPPMMAD